MYIIKRTTEYYGPETEVTAICNTRGLAITFSSRREANKAISMAGLNEGGSYLRHNQSSRTVYSVARTTPNNIGYNGLAMWRGHYLAEPITVDEFVLLYNEGLTQ